MSLYTELVKLRVKLMPEKQSEPRIKGCSLINQIDITYSIKEQI